MSNPELMLEKREQGLRELAGVLSSYWPQLLGAGSGEMGEIRRIECFDISNISGQFAVGSMVVFIDGEASKRDYRKFRIRREQAPNDVAMMAEVLRRRLKRLQDDKTPGKQAARVDKKDESFESTPDLIVVDGGKGQLTAAYQVLQELGLDIPVVGMTKREEELLLPVSGSDLHGSVGETVELEDNLKPEARNLKPKRSSAHGAIARTVKEAQTQISTEAHFITIRLARGSEALFMVQRLRDEAHRFAITYHRKLRAKGFLDKK